jgi:hypothetical protein
VIVWGLASLLCAFLCTIGFVAAGVRAEQRPPRWSPLWWAGAAVLLGTVGVVLLTARVVTAW